MFRNRWVWASLTVAAIVGAMLAVWVQTRVRSQSRPEFADLDTALEPLRDHGWELSVPPNRGGPYRLLPDGSCLGPNPAMGLSGRVRDTNGAVVEEINLRGLEGRDQSIAYLQTADGSVTMAVLVRVR